MGSLSLSRSFERGLDSCRWFVCARGKDGKVELDRNEGSVGWCKLVHCHRRQKFRQDVYLIIREGEPVGEASEARRAKRSEAIEGVDVGGRIVLLRVG